MIETAYDPVTGIVHSRSVGLLTIEEVGSATRRTRELMQRARDEHGRALYLVDARETMVQPREVIEEIERWGSFLDHPDDRMAVVLASTLSKLQTERVFRSDQERAFLSIEAARDWLVGD